MSGSPDSPQTVEIYFNFLGKLELPWEDAEPTSEEIELEQKKAALREKRREQYRRRVESGKAAEYYEKTKAARKAKMDADKEACRAEDQANGVYYLPNVSKEKKTEVLIYEVPENDIKAARLVDAAAV